MHVLIFHKMFSKTLLIVIFVSLVSDSYEQKASRFFRKDYTYIAGFASFYKIHTISKTWSDAKRTCALEGGTFWHPENNDEAHVLLSFWKSNHPKIKSIYLGISDIKVEGVFVTVDNKPIAEVYSLWAQNEPNDSGGDEDCVQIDQHGYMNDYECDQKYPFICKKTLDSLEWNNNCNIPNLDYSFNKDTGKCYKLHTTPLTWPEAGARCKAERTSLAVVKNQREAFYLAKLMESTPKPKLMENYQRGIYHLGFHNRLNEGWQTLKGIPINVEEAAWFENYEPDGREQCGSMFYTGSLINTDCNMKSFFICEHQPSQNTFLPVSARSTDSAKPLLQPFTGFGAE